MILGKATLAGVGVGVIVSGVESGDLVLSKSLRLMWKPRAVTAPSSRKQGAAQTLLIVS
jgi:hypothetical protein